MLTRYQILATITVTILMKALYVVFRKMKAGTKKPYSKVH